MGSITVRKRKDGSAAYTAQIRIMQKGVTVYQESQTFDRKTTAQAWLKRRETELAGSGAIAKANRKGVAVKEMIERYLEDYEKLRPLGKVKRATSIYLRLHRQFVEVSSIVDHATDCTGNHLVMARQIRPWLAQPAPDESVRMRVSD